jgi:hypothetical protein
MSENMREELVRFVADLKEQDEKVTWEAIAARCKEKFPKAEGVSLTANAIRKRYNASLKRSESSQPSEDNKGSRMITVQDKDQLLKELMEGLEDLIEDHVRGIIERVSTEVARRVFDEKITKVKNVPILDRSQDRGYPPAPALPETVKGTRRHAVQRGKVAGTVDAELLELFERERKERGCSVSRMLDIVIWNYFGIGKPEKPKLSFELSEPSDNKA